MSQVYVNNQGFRVQLDKLRAGHVECFPQGGGFHMSIPFDVWVRDGFEIDQYPREYRAARVSFYDSFDEGPAFNALVSQDRWNGWVMPLFRFDEALRLAQHMSEVLRYDSATDSFVYLDPEASGEEERWPRETVELHAGIAAQVFAIGAGSWTWSIVEEPAAEVQP